MCTSKHAANGADAKRLVGKPLAMGGGVFRGPEPLGCAKPTYRIIGSADAALLMTARYSSNPNSNGPIAE
jgi:hypothetical protein